MRRIALCLAVSLVGLAACMKMPVYDFNNPFEAGITDGAYNSEGVLGAFTLTNLGLNIQMVKLDSISGFQMGAPPAETNLFSSWPQITPVHPVTISSFSIAKYEVTIAQYVKFLNAGGNDDHYHGNGDMNDTTRCGIISNAPGNYSVSGGRESYPVVYVSWYDCEAYCTWLSGITGQTWRLPTEAEWEYAAVGAGGHRTWPWGSTFYTNYCNNGYDYSTGGTKDGYVYSSPVGSYSSGQSPLGIYDMAGNVWEWCRDWYKSDYYSVSPVNDPLCTDNSSGGKVLRGGSFNFLNSYLRCSIRILYSPPSFSYNRGFRVSKSE